MAQAGRSFSTRRTILFGAAAAPVMSIYPRPPVAAASDARFIGWWRAMDRLEDRVNAAPQDTEEDQDRIDAMCARAGALQDRILQTPSSTRTAAEVKLRTLIRYFGNQDAAPVKPAQDVLAFIVRLPR